MSNYFDCSRVIFVRVVFITAWVVYTQILKFPAHVISLSKGCIIVEISVCLSVQLYICSSIRLSRIDILAKCQEFLGGYVGQTHMSLGNTLGVIVVFIYMLYL